MEGKEGTNRDCGGEKHPKCVLEAMQRLAMSSSGKTWLSGAKAGSGSQLENEDTAETEP